MKELCTKLGEHPENFRFTFDAEEVNKIAKLPEYRGKVRDDAKLKSYPPFSYGINKEKTAIVYEFTLPHLTKADIVQTRAELQEDKNSLLIEVTDESWALEGYHHPTFVGIDWLDHCDQHFGHFKVSGRFPTRTKYESKTFEDGLLRLTFVPVTIQKQSLGPWE